MSEPIRAKIEEAAAQAQAATRNEMEYHQARVLILINSFVRGQNKPFSGLTKLAKLDFLLRYPNFMERLLPNGQESWSEETRPTSMERQAVESRMIRYKYGPWDDRYYPILGALVGRRLAEYVPRSSGLAIRLTVDGRRLARALAAAPEWEIVAARAELLREHFNISGNRLKDMIYTYLPDAVDRPWRSEI
ncbi:hypothetical protein [Planotetraspora silvatica]|nr:hypothetical protein [Planotetraspora silvatica]